jgi:hypothetical protein
MTRWSLALSLAVGFALPAVATEPPKATPSASPEAIEFFEKNVRPVLVEKCGSCHGEKKQSAGLRLDTVAGINAGADNGPVITPGDPAKSRLIQSVRREGDYPMPPKAPLDPQAVAALTEWVKLGAALPDDGAIAKGLDPRKRWAFQPVRLPAVPTVRDSRSILRNEIDAFVLAKLGEKGLTPGPRADRRTLIRRASFDLTGLPPTADEIDVFEKDTSSDAWEKLIDRLLASPQYGERWGRYWLDVSRYADSKGYVFQEDRNYPFAYTYRDYVVRSFNEDKPFNQFVIEQLAADKLPLGADKTPLAAMGYLTLGRRFLNNTHDIIDDRIDVVTRGFMGLTVGCARCHDHKFDPIPQKDYYSLYGVFASSVEPKDLPLIAEPKRTPEVVAFEQELKKKEDEYAADVAKRHAKAVEKLRSAPVIAEYIRAYFDDRKKPADPLQPFLRDRQLSAFVFERWKAYLGGQLKSHSPVFSPLLALHAIPDGAFEAKAAAVIADLGKDTKQPAHPLVVKALIDAKPKAFQDAAVAVAGVISAPPKDQPELVAILGPGSPVDVVVGDFEKIANRADRDQLAGIKRKIDAFKATNPFAPPRAMVLNDGRPYDPFVFLRGNPRNRGPVVPRQFLEIAAGPDRRPFKDGSGRLELARAIASPDNPLTARVFVNRVWIGHFGQGLVRTPSDFGVRSDPPTHPELLDYLAWRFVEGGWSVKKLHKLIMLSATYQQVSTTPAELFKADPDNRLLARQNRRRLDFEAMRDSLLFAAGRLDLTVGGKPVDLFKSPFSTRRTVYGYIDRSNLPGTFRVFDVASPDQHSPQRFQTTVPQQALFLLNSPFVTEQAKALANRKEIAAADTADQKVTKMYRAALGRDPTREESELGREFVGDAEPGATFGKWEQYAQVLLLCNEFVFVD